MITHALEKFPVGNVLSVNGGGGGGGGGGGVLRQGMELAVEQHS